MFNIFIINYLPDKRVTFYFLFWWTFIIETKSYRIDFTRYLQEMFELYTAKSQKEHFSSITFHVLANSHIEAKLLEHFF